MGMQGKYKDNDVLFLLSEADDVVGIGFANIHSSTHILKLRICDAPDLAIGDEIINTARTYRVMSEPKKDIHNLIWSFECNLN